MHSVYAQANRQPDPGPAPTQHHLHRLLRRCRTPRDADQVHALLITTGHSRNPSTLLRLSSSPRPPHRRLARRLLLLSTRPFLWNRLISSSSRGCGGADEAILLFSLMLESGVSPDRFSLSLALNACSRLRFSSEGTQMHSLIVKRESAISSDVFLNNCLMSFYCRCGRVSLARRVFDRMRERDSVSWNTIIDGYAKVSDMDRALEMFERMEPSDRNSITWNSMIGGYARSTGGIDSARSLFDRMPDSDSVSWNIMIDGYLKRGEFDKALDLLERTPGKDDVVVWASVVDAYAKHGRLDEARRVFDGVADKDVVVWNVMMSGYVQCGMCFEALNLFDRMRSESSLSPDDTTLATALSAVAELGRIEEGVSIHHYAEKIGLSLEGKTGVALVHMYAKCGWLEKAVRIFKAVECKNVDHWNAMIGGLAVHGLGSSALQMFERMLMKPDDITFVNVLSACSHAGLVEEGLACFEAMEGTYGVTPKVQHYGCLVDLLGRAGRVEEARRVIDGMPMEPNDVVWRSLISACGNHGEFRMGRRVATRLIEIEEGSRSASSYVLLSNLYAGCGMWGEAYRVRVVMGEREIRKAPGRSWIELDGVVHEFAVNHILCI
ncbi:Pentatricopeptide repeat-containing protein [Acorus calamus]|uniref:Pentatricopeptide repeat-containing protein n=1 Tax=Acorus calamus TaxID=4465 RepID=A0AAV9DZ59_ACOCL|nr:Pentatricopeptide repeat-containing protein [Acorus calamus]